MTSAAFSSDGGRVVTASADNTARVWDAATGKPLISALRHQDAVWIAAFSPDGQTLAASLFDQTIRIFEVGAK